jgi:hypothetical protein
MLISDIVIGGRLGVCDPASESPINAAVPVALLSCGRILTGLETYTLMLKYSITSP